jgi:hypothetical protein
MTHMAFHPIPDVASLTLRIQGPQLQLMSSRTYWRQAVAAPFTALEVKGLADVADTEMLATNIISGGVNTSCEYVGAEARALDTISSPVHFSNANAGVGGVAVQLLPLEIALVFSVNSGVPGRSHRNRFYWPGIDTGALDATPRDGLFSPATVTAYHLAFSTFFAAITAAGFVQVVASPKLGTYVDSTGFDVKRRPGSQRRREP